MNIEDAATEIHHAPIAGSAGAMLAAARKSQRLSVEDVARQLRLSVAQISAVEADDYSQLPGAVFARGFARSYAKLLKLDPDALPSMTNTETPAAVPPMLVHSRGVPFGEKKRPLRTLYGILALVLVAGLASYEFMFTDHPAWPPPPATSSSTVMTPVKPAVAPAALPVDTAEKDNPAESAPPTPESVPQSQVSTTRELHFMFSKDSWVEVRDGMNNILISKVNLSGTELKLSGMPPLLLVIGNAQGVRLVYDDKPIDLAAYSTNDVARLKLE